MGCNTFVASSCAWGKVRVIILAQWITLEEVTLVSMASPRENSSLLRKVETDQRHIVLGLHLRPLWDMILLSTDINQDFGL